MGNPNSRSQPYYRLAVTRSRLDLESQKSQEKEMREMEPLLDVARILRKDDPFEHDHLVGNDRHLGGGGDGIKRGKGNNVVIGNRAPNNARTKHGNPGSKDVGSATVKTLLSRGNGATVAARHGSHGRALVGLERRRLSLSSPAFANCFSEDPVRDAELRQIREKLYKKIWSRSRRDETRRDFIISESGVTRNVFGRGGPRMSLPGDSLDHKVPIFPICAEELSQVDPRMSHDLRDYIARNSTVEIAIELKSEDSPEARAALDAVVANVQAFGRVFRGRCRQIDIRIYPARHQPGETAAVRPPLSSMNETAMNRVCDELNNWGLESVDDMSLRATVVFSKGVSDNDEILYCLMPFYPLKFTGWKAYGIFWGGLHRPLPSCFISMCDQEAKRRDEVAKGLELTPEMAKRQPGPGVYDGLSYVPATIPRSNQNGSQKKRQKQKLQQQQQQKQQQKQKQKQKQQQKQQQNQKKPQAQEQEQPQKQQQNPQKQHHEQTHTSEEKPGTHDHTSQPGVQPGKAATGASKAQNVRANGPHEAKLGNTSHGANGASSLKQKGDQAPPPPPPLPVGSSDKKPGVITNLGAETAAPAADLAKA